MEKSPLNELANNCFQIAVSKGFYNLEFDNQIPVSIAKLHAEVSELFEAFRKDQLHIQCDKQTTEKLSCQEEELADIIIQAVEIGKYLNIDIDRAVRIKSEYNKSRELKNGGKKV